MSVAPSKHRTVWGRDVVCHYCGIVPPVSEQTVDHIWPKALGGSDANWNLVAACAPCNEGFGHRTDKCTCDFCIYAWRQHGIEHRPLASAHVGVNTVAAMAGFALLDGEWIAAIPRPLPSSVGLSPADERRR